MLFNSLDFAVFLPIVFFLYWFVFRRNTNQQNILVTIASYVFYGWWDWRFLLLIVFSTIVDYFIGRTLGVMENEHRRKVLLWLSILVNLGVLGFFKYYNFFAANFVEAFSLFGTDFTVDRLNIILPVGISFYTFQTMSYTIDVYRRKLEPTKDIFAFGAFVSFFPQLVAGPIERATNLLPQFYKNRSFEYSDAVIGMRQILWGLFKKIVIADSCAEYVNLIFSNSDDMSGSALALGAVFFAFQIYGDFSGYSDIAIGTARLFGFRLMQNFAFPYFSRDIAEFWRRWHISLSTWFRDYLYIPLGGSKGASYMKIRNVFIIFIVSGFWHGANWTFIVWGALNAVFFLPLLLTKRNRINIESVSNGRYFPSFRETINMLLTFGLTVFAWIFFRAESLSHAWSYILGIFDLSLFTVPQIGDSRKVLVNILLIMIFILVEWNGRKHQFAIEELGSSYRKPVRWSIYYVIIASIFFLGGKSQSFIYFQF